MLPVSLQVRKKMKLQPFVQQLEKTPEFGKFRDKYADAYLVAGFFVLDFETNQHLYQIDYFVPREKKVAAFTLGEEQIVLQLLDTMNDKTPERLEATSNIDLDALQGILEDEMKNRSMTEEIKKIIAVIQTVERKKVWILNCVLSGMEILKAHVEDASETVLKMERASVMEYIKKIPGGASMMGGQQQGAPEEMEEPSPEDLEAKIHELDRIKKELEKEKQRIEKEKKTPKKTASKAKKR